MHAPGNDPVSNHSDAANIATTCCFCQLHLGGRLRFHIPAGALQEQDLYRSYRFCSLLGRWQQRSISEQGPALKVRRDLPLRRPHEHLPVRDSEAPELSHADAREELQDGPVVSVYMARGGKSQKAVRLANCPGCHLRRDNIFDGWPDVQPQRHGKHAWGLLLCQAFFLLTASFPHSVPTGARCAHEHGVL